MSFFLAGDVIEVDGLPFDPGMHPEGLLARSVIISLFTWRRAEPDDILPGDERNGSWMDSYPVVPNDRMGSRLWLLSRSSITSDTVIKAREYAEQALQWMIDDGVASRIDVTAERLGIDKIAIRCVIYRGDVLALDISFTDAWRFIANAT